MRNFINTRTLLSQTVLFGIILTVNAALILSIFFLVSYIEELLVMDSKENMDRVISLNREIIVEKIERKIQHLTSLGEHLISGVDLFETPHKWLKDALQSSSRGDPSNISVADTDGTAFFASGQTLNISSRRHYLKAISGKPTLSEPFLSRLTGNTVFAFSIPLFHNGKIVGTLQEYFSPEALAKLCMPSTFVPQGVMRVITARGYTIFATGNTTEPYGATNFFRKLYSSGNKTASEQLQNDIKKGNSGFVNITEDKTQFFISYTPLALGNYYLVISVPSDAVASHATRLQRLLYTVLIPTAIVFSLLLSTILMSKMRERQHLKRLAYLDQVTKGNTLNKFKDEASHILSHASNGTYSLLVFDIIDFKYINHCYSYMFGNKILFEVNKVITKRLIHGEMLARISDDYFVVLLKQPSHERLNSILAPMPQSMITINFLGGVYPIHDNRENLNLIIDKARITLQENKNDKRKRVCFYSEDLYFPIIHNEQIKLKIAKALLRNEIIPFYQPKVDINTRRLVGAEALARWRSEDGSITPPGAFIPQIEKTGLVTKVDMAVFESVLRFLSSAIKNHIACVPISVNFSRHHFLNNNFPDSLSNLLEQYQVPPSLVEIELTETLFAEDNPTMNRIINRLREKKLRLIMDDFGSGYSSLSMLNDLPLDGIKIDQAFLHGSKASSRREIIFGTMIELAHRLDMEIVVEGVETEENVELMKRFHCYVAQGYYYGKPLPEQIFATIFRQGHVV